ncbi:MAG TPA: class I SAM-dependent methyltransferase, partial [Burkholderiales bacterium]|nr:class I SAM-dependent methyltransferase [Burkholderiales bacterium]
MAAACRICGNTEGNSRHFPKEMMFGTREEFEYLECGRCGCLQIAAIPADLAKYYPRESYYSYKPPKKKLYPAWVLRLRQERTRHFLGERTLLGALGGALTKRSEHFDWFRHGHVRLDSRSLDVGCGSGTLLLRLQREGFRSLLGADPFIEADIDYGNGVRILKRSVGEIEGRFDFVMLHHSFEHMLDPADTLVKLQRLLSPAGTLLLRIPVSDCHARRKYGLNWMAWDAPRHLYLHSVKSMELLAAAAKMEIFLREYDSSCQQFTSSELYIRGIPYIEHGKYRPGNRPDAFTQDEWDG